MVRSAGTAAPVQGDTGYGLPAGVRVMVRGWLSCNQILLGDGDGDVLIDSGYHTHADKTLALLDARTRRVTRLINTHCHSDHVGGNAAVAARYGLPHHCVGPRGG